MLFYKYLLYYLFPQCAGKSNNIQELKQKMGKLFEETAAAFAEYVVPTYAPGIMFVRGENARLWDDDGNEYLDFAAGISVCNLGHCNRRVTAAIQEMMFAACSCSGFSGSRKVSTQP